MLTGNVLRLPAPLVPAGVVDDDRPAEEVGTAPLSELLRRYRRGLLHEAMHRAGGRQQQAARLLGLHRQSLARMLREGDGDGVD
jgi:DNA-binding NtrC family response regulator